MLYIIINPFSGKDKGKKVLLEVEEILKSRSVEYKVLCSEYSGHAVALASICANDETCTCVAVIGGDGTFNEVINGFYPCQKPIGFIPAGTGNDFVRTIGIPKDTAKALDIILKGKTVMGDIIKHDKGYCLNLLGTGFDVEILLRANKYRKIFKGAMSYYLALLVTLLVFKNRTFTFSIDNGQKRSEKGLILAFANGIYCGGGLPVCPSSDATDGKCNFVLIKKVNRLKLPYLFAKFLKGKVLELNCVESCFCDSITLEVSPYLPLNNDGELMDFTSLTARIIPKAINMFVL